MKRLILFILLLFSCKSIPESFITDLHQKIKSGEVQIDIKSITSFDWDYLHIFTPYTTVEDVNNRLGFNWGKAYDTGIFQRDDINLLVFVKDNKVIKYYEVPLHYGNFSEIKLGKGLSKDKAIFELNIRENWPYLKLIGSII